MTVNLLWQHPPQDLQLTPATVHVWGSSIVPTAERLDCYTPLLSAQEQARASQFRFDRDRDRFILSRGILRQILADYLRCPPAELVFGYGEFGKPYLANSPLPQLQFNLSHSGDIALYALTCDRQVGIDIETKRPLSRLAKLAEHCLTLREKNHLLSLEAGRQPTVFFSYWTCKEAFLKAIGKGLTQAMDDLEVLLNDSPQLLQAADISVENWRLAMLHPAEDYTAAIAVEGTDWQLSCWRYVDESVE